MRPTGSRWSGAECDWNTGKGGFLWTPHSPACVCTCVCTHTHQRGEVLGTAELM